jgi:hypothetical protein
LYIDGIVSPYSCLFKKKSNLKSNSW